MTEVRSTAAVALLAALLASCTGLDERQAARPAEAPPLAAQDEQASSHEVHTQAEPATAALEVNINRLPAANAEQGTADVVVTGKRIERPDYSSPSAVVAISEATLNRAPGYAPSPPPPAMRVAGTPVSPPDTIAPPPYLIEGRDKFASVDQNPFRVVAEEPVSTFSIDVDTASYGFVRASLNRNVLPQPDAVRTEELVNYFPYDYAAPRSAERPFSTSVDVFPSPWTEGRKLVRVGIRGYEVARATRPRANLVFLIDTSGSMQGPGRLPLVKQSLAMLLEQLGPNDRVAIVTYAGNAGTALEPTPASQKARILSVIERLGAGGSTAGAEGIRQAYALAERSFDAEGVNRVILATEAPRDARFATGVASFAELLRGGRYSGSMTYDDVLQMVGAARGEDAYGYRTEFVQLVRAAKTASAMARLGE